MTDEAAQENLEREPTIADLDVPDQDARSVNGGIITDNKDPDQLVRHGRNAEVIESVNVKYT